ncbi:hypothetical protein [Tenacibaculum finnmarkense]|uniref:hypothetical protein n=1 Tax=Tenacibaculum finnmarkense TaxID=2781243 RepID=UPI001E3FB7D0|nr:hypothetical protein [Tenacibaculum finnmarkense]MCD8413698.1 hypothetical protein [Tenacibaculum finnmarkense genomovar ulcerans]MCG8208428.1 hypothetical protein [Tenacibaculum finnmarkense genomovar finnmarkense]MCG8724373.1 CRISPR-associated protein Cas2 [Tenacibaculum finnmarkense]MCG8742682.1 CRISPR-associated protein Cas2 [Tenacibaculum finnmarkense]MCG8766097.1 CRISPR-associated protein Cas2 [Tenacibaculum finnmarkense]
MATFIVSYDVSDDADYDKLYEKLKSYNGWAKITESTWAIVSSKKATEIRNELKPFIGKSGKLFVIKSGMGAAWTRVIASNEWLKKNL